MIDSAKINKSVIQIGGSCVLSSYAIVANYFTGLHKETFFEDYCRHFKIRYSSASDAERQYESHFVNEYATRRCKGYEVIIDLHDNARESSFEQCRKTFTVDFISETVSFENQMLDILKSEEALANVTYLVGRYAGGVQFHSITVWFDGQLHYRDTNSTGTQPLVSLSNLGLLQDSVLYRRK
jgi:hypothetical protein